MKAQPQSPNVTILNLMAKIGNEPKTIETFRYQDNALQWAKAVSKAAGRKCDGNTFLWEDRARSRFVMIHLLRPGRVQLTPIQPVSNQLELTLS